MKNRTKILSLILAISILGLTACSGQSAQTAPAAESTKVEETTENSGVKGEKKTSEELAETSDGILRVGLPSAVTTLDSQLVTDGTSMEVIAAFNDGLYTLDADGNPIPALADSQEVSDDGLEYTIKLKDAKWSNGDPVTADDFVYAFQRLSDPKVASEYSFISSVASFKNVDAVLNGEKDVEELGVTAEDDKTLKIELERPVSFFNTLLAFSAFKPANRNFIETQGDNYGTSAETIVGTGAFKISEYEPSGTKIRLVKNEDYYDADKVHLSGLEYDIVEDAQQGVLSFENGDLDVVEISGELVEQYKDDPQFIIQPTGFIRYLEPNLANTDLQNKNLRLALALSFDKNAAVNNVLKDGSVAADYLIPSGLATGPDKKDYRDGAPTYLSTNKDEAKKYFETAKEELGKESFTFELIADDTNSQLAQFLQSEIQTNLEGVTVNLQTLPKKERYELQNSGQFDLVLAALGPDYADPLTFFDLWTTGAYFNPGNWSNEEYDKLVEDVKTTLANEPEKRWNAFYDLERIILDDDVSFFPVNQNAKAELVRDGVSGIEFHGSTVDRIYKNTVKK